MQTNKKIVLFDIDYTLFDVDKFKQKMLEEIIKSIGHKNTKNIEKKLQDIYIASRRSTGYFNPKVFIRDLLGELNINTDPKVLAKSIFKDTLFLGNLYKETKDVLGILSKNKLLRIGIFSGGEDDFQRNKIKEIEDFLHKEHIHIYFLKEKELSSIIERYKKYKLYLVDDRLDILNMAKNLNEDTSTIWIKRGRFAKQQKEIPGFAPDATITNLKEVVGLVNTG